MVTYLVVEILGVVQMMIDIGSKSRIESLEMQHDPVILDKMPRGAEGKWWPGPRGTERPDIYSTLQQLQYNGSVHHFWWNPGRIFLFDATASLPEIL